MSKHTPDHRSRPARRLGGQLAPGTAYASTGTKYAIIPIAGATTVRVRGKVVTADATLDYFFLPPDYDVDQAQPTAASPTGVAYASLVGTKYTSPALTQLALTAGTEAKSDITVVGEAFLLILLTGGGTGTIGFVDVSMSSPLR